jgi:hypothetical protein
MLKSKDGLHKSKDGSTFFVRLPYSRLTAIEGGCQCIYCKAHPHATPQWDTLAIDVDTNHTWTVHFPELWNK